MRKKQSIIHSFTFHLFPRSEFACSTRIGWDKSKNVRKMSHKMQLECDLSEIIEDRNIKLDSMNFETSFSDYVSVVKNCNIFYWCEFIARWLRNAQGIHTNINNKYEEKCRKRFRKIWMTCDVIFMHIWSFKLVIEVSPRPAKAARINIHFNLSSAPFHSVSISSEIEYFVFPPYKAVVNRLIESM